MKGASSTLERDIEAAGSGIQRVSSQVVNVADAASRKSKGDRVSGPPGWSLILNGNLQATEDFTVEGTIEGNIDLQDHVLTINHTGEVHGNVYADTVVLFGTVRGNICAADHIELRRTAIAIGDLVASRIVIHDGAYFKGSIDIRRRKEIVEAKSEFIATQAGPIALSDHLISRFHELVDKKLLSTLTADEFRELREIERFMDESERKLMGTNDAVSMDMHLQMTNKLAELVDELKSFSTSKRPK